MIVQRSMKFGRHDPKYYRRFGNYDQQQVRFVLDRRNGRYDQA